MAYGATSSNNKNGAPRIPEFKLREQMCEIGRKIWLKGFCAGNDDRKVVELAARR